ncbi:MAG: hypothetical protein HC765_01895 [Brachymonas sp.]|nr:hypothetical protein [Brachymonas sp.]
MTRHPALGDGDKLATLGLCQPCALGRFLAAQGQEMPAFPFVNSRKGTLRSIPSSIMSPSAQG